MDFDRPRRIVRLAASRVKASQAKSWLKNDEEGTWESQAKRYLEQVPALMAKKNLNLTEEQVDDEIASALQISALEAVLAHAKKRGRK